MAKVAKKKVRPAETPKTAPEAEPPFEPTIEERVAHSPAAAATHANETGAPPPRVPELPPFLTLAEAQRDGLPIKTLPVAYVSIRRGMDVMTSTVFEHEVPILEMLYGPGKVTQAEPPEGEEFEPREVVDSATDEYLRLEAAYKNNRTDFVRAVFPRGAADLARETGLAMVGNLREIPQSSTRRGGVAVKPGPKTVKKAAFKK